jgi:hypothetical protein
MVAPNYADLCDRFFQSFVAYPLLVDLAARATSGLELPVPLAAWIACKTGADAICQTTWRNVLSPIWV